MSDRMQCARAYEKALVAGDREGVSRRFTDDVVYWVAGAPPIGGEWTGRERVLDALWNREPGLGAADWGYEDVWRDWYDADDRVIIEIRERSWLKSDPKDVMDQRTCCILGVGLQPRALADLDDHPLLCVVPVAPHVRSE